jgi:hypothetical protein
MENINDKSYNEVLTEANDMFRAQGLSILGEGYKEIATNGALFESYVESLTEGATANDAAVMAQLMENANSQILQESSITGIQPVASLSMPVIRKLWPKFALKDAIKKEPAKTPRFVVSYTKPYLEKAGHERVYLPKGLTHGVNDTDASTVDRLDEAGMKKLLTKEVELSNGESKVVDFTAEATVANTPSAMKVQPLDECYVTVEDVKIGKRLSVLGTQVYNLGAEKDNAQLVVAFDGANDKVTLALVGGKNATEAQGTEGQEGYVPATAATSVNVTVLVGVSSEYNEDEWSVGFDIKRQDIDIPTGQHINAPLPIEAINDMMALYQIDGTKETVDLMTNVFAQKLDIEILNFIQRSFVNRPHNEAFAGYGVANEFLGTFDCKPAAGFAGSPKAWREELKPLIDYYATKIKTETYLTTGVFTIIGNPLDVNLITNVDWQFRGGQGVNMSGVDVDYSVGSYVGANAYKVIASPNVPQGALYITFTPSTDKQLTYCYYPYSFTLSSGYVDSNRSRVPSLMMTKRHTMYEFMPAVAAIQIKNNTGSPYNMYGEDPYKKFAA